MDSIKLLADIILIVLAAMWTWFISFSQAPHLGSPLPFLGIVIGCRLVVYLAMRLHRMSWLNVSRYEVLRLGLSALTGTSLILLVFLLLPQPFSLRNLTRPQLVVLTEPAFYMLLLCGARIMLRSLMLESRRGGHHRILIVGALDAGRSLAMQLQESSTHYEVVGFVDDEPSLQKRRVRGLPVMGRISDALSLIENHGIHEIVIANPSLAPDKLRELVTVCSQTHVPLRILPPLKELMGEKATPQALREIRMEDLLPRSEVNLDHRALARYLEGRIVLVTGGGGSIGGELCRQALVAGASQLIVLGRGENSVFEMMAELEELNETREAPCRMAAAICDVRDRVALERVFDMYRPQVVFHAGAHKHVPLMEQHPSEAVKNNVGGTLNVVQLATLYRVERLVMVSTDKAVDPSSIMGATKRIGELIVRGHAAQYGLNMVSVRFGNVLGSRGSVVPTMSRQIRRRLPVTVTDPEMVRYFMTIPEAVQLLLQAGARGGTGDVYMLEMGRPVRILDLAYDLIRLSGLVPEQDIPVRIIGRRPGEKLSEALRTEGEEKAGARDGDFHVAPTAEVKLDELMEQLHRLQVAAWDMDEAGVRRLLHEIVPNFISPDEGPNLVEGQSSTPHSSTHTSLTPISLARINGARHTFEPEHAEQTMLPAANHDENIVSREIIHREAA
jgi:FlaA1/EpsC-like NDP-sugar epimerase